MNIFLKHHWHENRLIYKGGEVPSFDPDQLPENSLGDLRKQVGEPEKPIFLAAREEISRKSKNYNYPKGIKDTNIYDVDPIPEIMSNNEMERMQKSQKNIYRHYLNPSFLLYLEATGKKESVDKALEAAIKYPHDLHYRESNGVIEITKRPRAEISDLPDDKSFSEDFSITIDHGHITDVNGVKTDVRGKYIWENFEKIIFDINQKMFGASTADLTPREWQIYYAFSYQLPHRIADLIKSRGQLHNNENDKKGRYAEFLKLLKDHPENEYERKGLAGYAKKKPQFFVKKRIAKKNKYPGELEIRHGVKKKSNLIIKFTNEGFVMTPKDLNNLDGKWQTPKEYEDAIKKRYEKKLKKAIKSHESSEQEQINQNSSSTTNSQEPETISGSFSSSANKATVKVKPEAPSFQNKAYLNAAEKHKNLKANNVPDDFRNYEFAVSVLNSINIYNPNIPMLIRVKANDFAKKQVKAIANKAIQQVKAMINNPSSFIQLPDNLKPKVRKEVLSEIEKLKKKGQEILKNENIKKGMQELEQDLLNGTFTHFELIKNPNSINKINNLLEQYFPHNQSVLSNFGMKVLAIQEKINEN